MGDIVGSVYESPSRAIKRKSFPLFARECTPTDDSILTIATADALLGRRDYAASYRAYYRRYPTAGYGTGFAAWAAADDAPAPASWGNGAAMRVAPIGFYFSRLDDVVAAARASALVSHRHPEAVRAACAVASAVFLARAGSSKEQIAAHVTNACGYDLKRSLDTIRPSYGPDLSSQGSVPEAIIAFLESSSVEDAIRNAVSLGGDSDTQAAIAGGIAEAFFGMTGAEEAATMRYLDAPCRSIVARFARYRRARRRD